MYISVRDIFRDLIVLGVWVIGFGILSKNIGFDMLSMTCSNCMSTKMCLVPMDVAVMFLTMAKRILSLRERAGKPFEIWGTWAWAPMANGT